MSKKLTTACLGLVALAAFALPAIASASPVLTHPTGTKLATGVKITGTNVGNTALTNGSNTPLFDCSKAVFTGELTSNTGTHIVGNITTATFTGTGGQDPNEPANMPECTGTNGFTNVTLTTNGTHPAGTKIDNEDVSNGTPYCITAASDVVTIRGGTCTEEARKITFQIGTTNPFGGTNIDCRYERVAALSGTLTTHSTGDATVTLRPEQSTEFIPEAGNNVLCTGKVRFEMTITLETDRPAPTTEPLYIS